MQKLLFPTNFSVEAKKALRVAAQLARLFDADLHLVHVFLPVLPGYTRQIHDADAQYRETWGWIERA
ncbi:universal stress protein [Spirosoma utsteinense]|uniref:Nucleotide-binding universal stress UspA family protein n=1 Tax=Spirosoma utsteinense TaxID=2585773 RepID=A0ABR6W6C2_9BACT|nr:universal stress protein [Spirosoma utsteinense]MBC3789069.1 nucleotide-binding universal stress UspA family protein [Spirosoma utsteinense]MBC3792140.1 nucleotide-binding universal stress UspA family protein [Spirosoma utsteinense]